MVGMNGEAWWVNKNYQFAFKKERLHNCDRNWQEVGRYQTDVASVFHKVKEKEKKVWNDVSHNTFMYKISELQE